MKSEKKISLVLFFSVVVVGILGIIAFDNFQFLSSIPLSNTSFTRSIVLERALNLDGYTQSSGIDIIKYNNHYYPAYPPGYSFMAVPFYGTLQVFNFIWTKIFSPMTGTVSLFLESLALAAPSILSLALLTVLLFWLLNYYKFPKSISVITAWALPFTTFLLGYLPSAFFHLPVAALLFLSFYLLVTTTKYTVTRSLIIGLLMGGVVVTEYVTALCFIPLGLAFFVRSKSYLKSGLVLSGFVIGLLVLGLYNNQLFGAPWKFGESIAATSGNREAISKGISFSGNPLTGLSGNYLSVAKGLLPNAPLAILALPGFWLFFKKKRSDAIISGFFIVIVSGVYSFWHDSGGGWSLGPRFYTSLMPFFFTFAGFLIAAFRKELWFKMLLTGLILCGVFTGFWSLMMGPRLIVPRAQETFGTPAIQRFNRLPVILAEGNKITTNVAPYLVQNFKEFPLLSGLTFTTWFTIYSLLILLIIVGSLVYLLRLCNDSKQA